MIDFREESTRAFPQHGLWFPYQQNVFIHSFCNFINLLTRDPRVCHTPSVWGAALGIWLRSLKHHRASPVTSLSLSRSPCPSAPSFSQELTWKGHLELSRGHAEEGACGGDTGKDGDQRSGVGPSEPRTVQTRGKTCRGCRRMA